MYQPPTSHEEGDTPIARILVRLLMNAGNPAGGTPKMADSGGHFKWERRRGGNQLTGTDRFRQYKRSAYQDWECQGVLSEEDHENNEHLQRTTSSLVATWKKKKKRPAFRRPTTIIRASISRANGRLCRLHDKKHNLHNLRTLFGFSRSHDFAGWEKMQKSHSYKCKGLKRFAEKHIGARRLYWHS